MKYKHFKHTGRMERFSGYPIVTNGDIGVQFRTGVEYNLGIAAFLHTYRGYFENDGLVTIRFKMIDTGSKLPVLVPTSGRYPCKRALRGVTLIDSILLVNSIYQREYRKKSS